MTRPVSKSRCPRCKKNGRDTKGDNYITYDDGHSFCYGCGYYGHPPKSLNNMSKKLYKWKTPTEKPYDFNEDDITFDIPAPALLWLNKYGVTERERLDNKIFYDHTKDYLCLPIFDGERLVCTNSRYFGSNPEHPKYVTKGWKSGHFKVFPNPNRIFVLTEDYISALRVGRQYNAIPLLGASMPLELCLSLLARADCILVWLDPDKRDDCIKISNRISQYKESSAILTEKDPKDYNDDEINQFIQGTPAIQRVLSTNESHLHSTEASG